MEREVAEQVTRTAPTPAAAAAAAAVQVVRSRAAGLPDVYSAEKLPRSDVGDYIERCVQSVLPAGAPPIAVRLVSNCQKATSIPSPMQATFCAAPGEDLPPSILYTSKTLCLFRLIDGTWVMSFMLYAYEYGDDAPACNRGRVYLSYLDSVPYVQPYTSHSAVYKMTLMAYFDWVRRRGFSTVHLWSAPASNVKEFAYICWCHPQHHATLDQTALRQWYGDIVEQCQNRGIVSAVTDFYASSFRALHDAVAADDSSLEGMSCDGDDYDGSDDSEAELVREHRHSSFHSRACNAEEEEDDSSIDSASLKSAGGHSESEGSDGMHAGDRPVLPPCFRGDLWLNELWKELTPDDRASTDPVDNRVLETVCHTAVKSADDLFVLELAAPDAPLQGDWASRVVAPSLGRSFDAARLTDTDGPRSNEAVNDREALLEALMWGHLQFDTLGAAMHSTAMLLYALHQPLDQALNPAFRKCTAPIVVRRHYCDLCSTHLSHDLCDGCSARLNGKCEVGHPTALLPIRFRLSAAEIAARLAQDKHAAARQARA